MQRAAIFFLINFKIFSSMKIKIGGAKNSTVAQISSKRASVWQPNEFYNDVNLQKIPPQIGYPNSKFREFMKGEGEKLEDKIGG